MAASIGASTASAATAGLATSVARSLQQKNDPNLSPVGGNLGNGDTFASLLAGQSTSPTSTPGSPSSVDATAATVASAIDHGMAGMTTAADALPAMPPAAADLSPVALSSPISLSDYVGKSAGAGTTTGSSRPEKRAQERQQPDAAPVAVPLVDLMGTLAPMPMAMPVQVQASPSMSSEASPTVDTQTLPQSGKETAGVPLVQAAGAGAVPPPAVEVAANITPAAVERVTVLRQERHLAVPAPGSAADPLAAKGPISFPGLATSGGTAPDPARSDAGMVLSIPKPLDSPKRSGSQVAASADVATTNSAPKGLTRGGLASVLSDWSTFSKPWQGASTGASSSRPTDVFETAASPVSGDAALASAGSVPAFQQVLAAVKDHIETHGAPVASPGGAEPSGQLTTSDPVRVLVVRLQPEDLGEVKVRLTLQDGSISIRVEAKERSAAEFLQSQRSDLVEGLKSSGYSVDAVSIHAAADMAAPQNPSSGSSSQSGAAAGQGSPMGPGTNDGGMPRGGGDGSARGGQSSGPQQIAEPVSAGQSIAGEVDTSARSGVYL